MAGLARCSPPLPARGLRSRRSPCRLVRIRVGRRKTQRKRSGPTRRGRTSRRFSTGWPRASASPSRAGRFRRRPDAGLGRDQGRDALCGGRPQEPAAESPARRPDDPRDDRGRPAVSTLVVDSSVALAWCFKAEPPISPRPSWTLWGPEEWMSLACGRSRVQPGESGTSLTMWLVNIGPGRRAFLT